MGGKRREIGGKVFAIPKPRPPDVVSKSKKVASRSWWLVVEAEKLETLEIDHRTVKRITGSRYSWTTRFRPVLDEKFSILC